MREAREALIRAARDAEDRGMNRGTSGNMSVRVPGGMLVTPSGMAPRVMAPEDPVLVAPDGSLPAGGGPPSSEWRLHAAVYAARPDAGAVLHAHPAFATTLSCLRREIPAVHYLVGLAGGDSIPCTPYAPFGTEELAGAVASALKLRDACLMANHGLTVLADGLPAALELAAEVEWLAEVYWRALGAGDPAVLDADQMEDVRRRLSGHRSGAG